MVSLKEESAMNIFALEYAVLELSCRFPEAFFKNQRVSETKIALIGNRRKQD